MTEIEYLERYSHYQDPMARDSLLTEPKTDVLEAITARFTLCGRYAWAVPTEETLQALAELSPIVEIGAGTGYWAYELGKRGATVHAYDIYPPDGSEWTKEEMDGDHSLVHKSWYHKGEKTWTEVRVGGPEIMREYDPEWNLFLCWPPMSNMAHDALGWFRGDRVCYIGEGSGGCTANARFFRLLRRFYDVETDLYVPQWFGVHDYFTIYRRRSRRV